MFFWSTFRCEQNWSCTRNSEECLQIKQSYDRTRSQASSWGHRALLMGRDHAGRFNTSILYALPVYHMHLFWIILLLLIFIPFIQKYNSMFERNGSGGSFYLQSKVHRAKECLETVYKQTSDWRNLLFLNMFLLLSSNHWLL